MAVRSHNIMAGVAYLAVALAALAPSALGRPLPGAPVVAAPDRPSGTVAAPGTAEPGPYAFTLPADGPASALAEIGRTAFARAGWAPAATAAIFPGVRTDTAGGGGCTANFVFTSGRRTFLGQAAHCSGTGGVSEIDGCRTGTEPLGTPVTIMAGDRGKRTGTLAYSSWIAMQERGESDPDLCTYNDFALVELAPADAADVNPSIPYFGGPTGIDTDGLVEGEPVYTSGGPSQRLPGGRVGPAPAKAGASAGDVGGGRAHAVYTLSPAVPGDSGSAFLDGNGAAVGVLSTLNLDPDPVSIDATDLAKALAYAVDVGGAGEVELATGTEPFTATPSDVPLIDLSLPAGPPLG